MQDFSIVEAIFFLLQPTLSELAQPLSMAIELPYNGVLSEMNYLHVYMFISLQITSISVFNNY